MNPNAMALRVACVIPTFNGKSQFKRLLDSLQRQTVSFDLLVVDSESIDGTYELAMDSCTVVERISPNEFNHGGTRQLMVDKFPNYDIYVYLTQDVELEQLDSIERVIKPFSDLTVGAVCGRQLPHRDATLLAQHARSFNYPNEILQKTMSDAASIGIKTAFLSNSFSAYRRTALQAVGGFPKNVISTEDMFVAAKMLLSGWTVVYAGDAMCRHSHNYTIFEEFKRYFDIGVFHARESWIRRNFGGAGGEGLRYVISELKFLGWSRFYLWPSSLIRNAAKLLGYKLGQKEAYLPRLLKCKISMHRRYWEGRLEVGVN